MPPKGANPQQKGKQPKSSGGGGGSTSNSGGSSSSKPGPTWIAPKSITHPEHHHTLNHLSQVASYYATLSASSSSPGPSDTACRLQGEVVRSAKALSRKAVIRMDTSVKKASCPKCDTAWIQGLTASVRNSVSGPHDHVVKWTCAVCGSISRRPAPNLVPQIEEQKQDKFEQQQVDQDAMKASKTEAAGSDEAESKTISQRQRRRIASIKRQLLRQGGATSDVCPAKGSRRQRSKQRRARIAKRVPAPTNSEADSPRTKAPVHLSQANTIETPTLAHPSQVTPSSRPTTSAAAPPQASRDDSTADAQPASKKPRSQRPQLPHFNDRVQGSHWDDIFAKLLPATTKDDLVQEETIQRLQYWQKAARSRGDHLVITGVGKNGALGPQLP